MHYISGVGSSALGALAAVPSVIGSLACRVARFVYSWFKPIPSAPSWTRPLAGDFTETKGASYALKTLSRDVFSERILGFLEPKDLVLCMQACQAWNKCFQDAKTWENLCQIAFGAKALPARAPSDPSYQTVFQHLHKNFFGQPFYERHIGSVGEVPPIPPRLSPFLLLNKPDPCDRSQKIGEAYIWMYMPSHFYVQVKGSRDDKTVKVPVTINNLPDLFANPKEGRASKYDYIWDKVTEQHGDTKHPGGWICMRREVVDRRRSWADQKTNALAHGVIIPELLPRVLLNFSWNIRSGDYLDGSDPAIYARTSTMVTGFGCPTSCGRGTPSGLNVICFHYAGIDVMGVAVALSQESLGHLTSRIRTLMLRSLC